MLVGYARVSSTGQSLETQLEHLRTAGCEKVFEEKLSGRNETERLQLQAALEFVREGDILVITRLDRIARSMSDLCKILGRLGDKQVGFTCLLQPMVDTTSPEGRLMTSLLGAFAEFEVDLLAARQKEGIKRAQEAKKYAKRPHFQKVTEADVVKMKAAGLGVGEMARAMKCDRKTIYRNSPAGMWGPPPANLIRPQETHDASP